MRKQFNSLKSQNSFKFVDRSILKFITDKKHFLLTKICAYGFFFLRFLIIALCKPFHFKIWFVLNSVNREFSILDQVLAFKWKFCKTKTDCFWSKTCNINVVHWKVLWAIKLRYMYFLYRRNWLSQLFVLNKLNIFRLIAHTEGLNLSSKSLKMPIQTHGPKRNTKNYFKDLKNRFFP